MLKTNYHIHNKLCCHAFGTVMEYADAAYNAHFDIIGMSDHVPYKGNKFGFRMAYEQLPEYIMQVQQAKEKYEGKMTVLQGLESEFLFGYEQYYEELLTKYNMDYLILGQHFFNSKEKTNDISFVYDIVGTQAYVDYAYSVRAALSTGYYSILAHPDLVFIHDNEWDYNCEKACDIIVDAAVKYNIPVELNANGVRKGISHFKDSDRYAYPHYKMFEKVSKAKHPVLINADCHQICELDDEAMTKSYEIAKEWGLNLTDRF